MVTNEKFSKFVTSTFHVTDSEKYGWSFVFLAMLSKKQEREIEQVWPSQNSFAYVCRGFCVDRGRRGGGGLIFLFALVV